MISQSEGEIETIDIDNCLEHSDKTGFECNCQTDAVRLANPPQPKLRNSHSAQINESPALGSPVPQAILPFVWDFTTGVEYESAGRQVPKSSKVLRDDLAPLMFVLAAPTDIVLVTKRPRKKFLASLVTVGFQNLPHFQLRPLTKGLSIAGLRSYGLPGNHLRRSNVVKYRAISTPRPRADANLFHAQNHGSNEHKLHQHQEYQTEHKRKVANRIPQDRIKNIYKANVQLKNNVCDSEEGDISNNCDVYVCRSMEEIDAAAALFKNNVVIKAEFSSAGQGCRFKWGPSMTDTNRKKNYSNTKTKNGDKINLVRQWAKNRLKQDGCVTVEEKWKIELELSAEFLYGKWNGVSLQLTNHGRWCGQYLGKPVELIRSRSKSNTGKHIHSLENKKVVTKSNNKTTIKTSSLHMCFNAVDKQQACTKSKISKEVFDFVFLNQAVQKKLFPLNIPATCGAPFGTCGADVAIVKNCEGDLEVCFLTTYSFSTSYSRLLSEYLKSYQCIIHIQK